MPTTPETDKSCRTCCHYRPGSDFSYTEWGGCDCPLPEFIYDGDVDSSMRPSDGTECLCWQPLTQTKGAT